MSFLEIEGLTKSFGAGENRIPVLKGISLAVEKGEIACLLGPSGSGKSTLLNIVGGIDTADAGSISIGGEKVEGMRERDLTRYRRAHLGYVFQLYNLLPDLTVRENVEVGAWLGERPLPVGELLKALGLWEHRDKMPPQLSGGQQQRTAIGRAIVKNPDLLLCDEPTGALDYAASKEILQLLETLNQTYGTTILIVTHNGAIARMSDRVVYLRDGKIRRIETGQEKTPAKDLEW